MIRFLSLAIAAATFVAGLPSASATVNIFLNGDFEDQENGLHPSYQDRIFQFGVGDWTTSMDRSAILPGTFDPGQVSALAPADSELRQDFFSFTSDIIDVSEDPSGAGAATFGGQVTHISFWVAHPDPPATKILVTLFYGDGTSIEHTYQTTTTGWEFFDITGQHDGGRDLTGISFFGNVSGRTFLDDVQVLVLVPEPGAVTLFLAAIAAVLFVRRRGQH